MIATYHFNFAKPVIGTAIHNGHKLRPFTMENLAINEKAQLMEEDPHTDDFARLCSDNIIVDYSRFEVDLNRQRHRAIYKKAADAWGLDSRKKDIPKIEIARSYKLYDEFYRQTKSFIQEMINNFGRVYIFDFHSYNHNRAGLGKPFDDPQKNPDIIIGTSNMKKKYIHFAEKIEQEIAKYDYNGHPINVQINVKYPGGNFPRWIHRNFSHNALCFSIELKKTFMNEWTGELDKNSQNQLLEIMKNVIRMPIFK